MRIARAVIAAGAVTALLAGTSSTAAGVTSSTAAVQPAALALAPGVTAFYEMNEPPGTTVMHDSGPNGLNAPVDPTGVTSGAVFAGATGYNWVHRAPEAPPPSPERVIQIPDNAEPRAGQRAVHDRAPVPHQGELRQHHPEGPGPVPGRTVEDPGPQGIPSCLFSGSGGQVATGAKTPLNDEQWHNLTCVLTSTGVTMYVDGSSATARTARPGRSTTASR